MTTEHSTLERFLRFLIGILAITIVSVLTLRLTGLFVSPLPTAAAVAPTTTERVAAASGTPKPMPTPVDPNAYDLQAMKTCSEVANMRSAIGDRRERGAQLVEHGQYVGRLAVAIPNGVAPTVRLRTYQLGRETNSYAIYDLLDRATAACDAYRQPALADLDRRLAADPTATAYTLKRLR